MENTLDQPRVQKPKNRYYGTSRYREDARDNPNPADGRWKEYDEESPRPRYSGGIAEIRGLVSELEMYTNALASTFSEQPRWQGIVEHANSLADELGMSREQFYSTALLALIEKYEEDKLTRAYNEAKPTMARWKRKKRRCCVM